FGVFEGVLRLRQISLRLLYASLGNANLARPAFQPIAQIGMLPVDPVERAQRFGQRRHRGIIRELGAGKRSAQVEILNSECTIQNYCTMSSNSTSKIRTANGGIGPPGVPCGP